MKRAFTLLFSPQGTVGRATWWTAALLWLLLLLIAQRWDHKPQNGPVTVAIFLVTLWPMFVIQVKRWHDRGRSAWWCFLTLAPVIGLPLTIIELGLLGPTQDFTSIYYRGPRSYRDRVRWAHRRFLRQDPSLSL